MQQVFTTGAFIRPALVDGIYVWVVESFQDDTYDSNGENIDPDCASKTIEGLLKRETMERD